MVRFSDFSIERLPDYSDDELVALRDQFEQRGIYASQVAEFYDDLGGAIEVTNSATGQGFSPAEQFEMRDMANEIRAHARRMYRACIVEGSIRDKARSESYKGTG